MKTTGRVNGIISNIVIVKADGPVAQNEICYVWTGDTKMMAEVIKVIGDDAYVQVYDSTRGLKIGDRVEFEGHMLEATLAPGLLSRNYDGLQNDLEKMDSLFIERGSITDPIDFDKTWEFTPLAKAGDKVSAASWLGEVKEQWIPHKIMVPFTMTGSYTVKSVAAAGSYKVTDTVAVLTDAEGGDHEVTMVQRWPVKQAIRSYVEKPRPDRIMETGVRAIDTFNPLAEGGTGFIPGPFGAGKTVLQHAISKQADADVIIMIACGERANEVVEIFKEFPELIDPHTGHPLMERTIIICNTSNMPVAAREASVYTGITIAEYFRDMGYDVAVIADRLLVMNDGTFVALPRGTYNAGEGQKYIDEGVVQSFTFGPLLVNDGAAVELPEKYIISTKDTIREPRTAIGQVDANHYVIIVADGRRDGWSDKGMTLQELQQMFVEQGCKVAYNLDGGGSATMVLGDQRVNKTSGSRERDVSDIVYFTK